jgi:acetyl esterase/lipase
MSGAEARGRETFTYKHAGELSILVDVYRGRAGPGAPVVVWLHGGALIMGDREWVPDQLVEICGAKGFILASADYRLAPETKLPHLIQDVTDAIAWIREHGPELFDAAPSPIAVIGESAGGYLALTAGFRASPAPDAVVSLWGYGDLTGRWYTEPSPHPRHHEIRMSREEAYEQVSGPAIADGRERTGNADAFYQHCRQHGTWPEAVSGWDPHREADRFRPLMPVANVTRNYPPTLLVHGLLDTDVPHDRSELMAAAFAEHGVEHTLLSVAGAEHGLDGADPREIDAAYGAVGAFLERHLRPR